MGLLINLGIALLAGLAGSFAFPHWNWWILLGPSLILLLFTLRSVGKRKHPIWLFMIGFVWGLTFFGGQLTWLTVPASSLVPWVALTILEALFIGFFALVWGSGDAMLRRHQRFLWPLKLIWAPVAWIAVEQLRAKLPFEGFPWSKLAFALVDTPFAAWAPWGGSIAVGGAALFVSAGVLEVFSSGPGLLRRPLSVLLVLTVLVLPFTIPVAKPVPNGSSLRIAAIQGNTPGRSPRTAYGEQYDVLNLHVKESLRLREALGADEKVDLILWAENSADVDPRIDERAATKVNTVTAAFDAPIILGTLGSHSKEIKNTIIYWKNGKSLGSYSKKHIVPFGEYLPWRNIIKTLSPDFAAMIPQDIHPGQGTAKLTVNAGGQDVTVATPICYEIADDDLVREAVKGANFIDVPTSNTFFGDSDEADQQLAIARFRAIEHGLDTVQVSTMDSTARIDANGKVLGRIIPNYTAGSFVTAVPLRFGATPATLYGEQLSVGVLISFFASLILIIFIKVEESWRT